MNVIGILVGRVWQEESVVANVIPDLSMKTVFIQQSICTVDILCINFKS